MTTVPPFSSPLTRYSLLDRIENFRLIQLHISLVVLQLHLVVRIPTSSPASLQPSVTSLTVRIPPAARRSRWHRNNNSSCKMMHTSQTKCSSIIITTLPHMAIALPILSWMFLVYSYNVLNISTSIEEYGHLQIYLVLSLLFSWILVFLVLLKGIRSMGRVSRSPFF